jgi:hypothetical protein
MMQNLVLNWETIYAHLIFLEEFAEFDIQGLVLRGMEICFIINLEFQEV